MNQNRTHILGALIATLLLAIPSATLAMSGSSKGNAGSGGTTGSGGAVAGSGGSSTNGIGDDLFLLTTSVSPNAVLIMDNSDSMNEIEWHEDFDPSAASYGCNAFVNNAVYEGNTLASMLGTKTPNICGNTRQIYLPNNPTYYDGRYLNWYFSNAADPDRSTPRSRPRLHRRQAATRPVVPAPSRISTDARASTPCAR